MAGPRGATSVDVGIGAGYQWNSVWVPTPSGQRKRASPTNQLAIDHHLGFSQRTASPAVAQPRQRWRAEPAAACVMRLASCGRRLARPQARLPIRRRLSSDAAPVQAVRTPTPPHRRCQLVTALPRAGLAHARRGGGAGRRDLRRGGGRLCRGLPPRAPRRAQRRGHHGPHAPHADLRHVHGVLPRLLADVRPHASPPPRHCRCAANAPPCVGPARRCRSSWAAAST